MSGFGSQKKLWFIGAGGVFALIGLLLLYAHTFGPVSGDTTLVQFVVTPDEPISQIAADLWSKGLVKSPWAFRIAYARESGIKSLRPGGYEIAPSMDMFTVADTLSKSPYLAWVVVPPGFRKEQIGDLLAKDLSWTSDELAEWNATSTDPSPSYDEGVYYPDTYLIASDETPDQVAALMRSHFTNAFAPYADLAAKENISWTNVLTIASLIEREAAGPDMKLISGIIWNRLNKGMALQLDASLQYAKGNEADGWWPVVHAADKYIDSPFNTYEHTGLPPHPIANPPLAAIAAVLSPQTTSCIYYLHDANGQIHCSATYAGQVANVNKYLK